MSLSPVHFFVRSPLIDPRKRFDGFPVMLNIVATSYRKAEDPAPVDETPKAKPREFVFWFCI